MTAGTCVSISGRPRHSESGIAYVVILFLIVIVATLGLAFLLKTGIEVSASLTRGSNTKAHYLAEAAANHAMWRLLNEEDWAPDADTYYMHSLGDGRYGYKVRPHTDTTFATIAAIGAVDENVVRQNYVLYVIPPAEKSASVPDGARSRAVSS